MSDEERGFDNVRDAGLQEFIGQRVIEITNSEPHEPLQVMLHFENGKTVRFPVPAEGFHIEWDD